MQVYVAGSVQLGYDPLRRLAWTTGNPNFCDRQFRSDIFYLCLAQGGGGGYCALLSQSYFPGVVWFGQDPYDAAQRAARTRRRD